MTEQSSHSVWLLWFHEWEANYVVGVFSTKEEAEWWRGYFISYPDSGYTGMEHFHENNELEDRLEVQEWPIGKINSKIKVDNLKYLEHKFDQL